MTPICGEKAELYYMDTEDFIDIEATFETSSYELEIPLPKGETMKKIIGIMKDELREKTRQSLPH